MPDTITSQYTSPYQKQFLKLVRGLTGFQLYHIERGCISGDFTMNTVNALKRKGLFHLVIDSPNGQCGFMKLTPLGERVRAHLFPASKSESPNV